MKLVSVIIPVYKAEKYIAETVQSVLNQTYTHFELLIVDDGTPDRSIEICQQFSDPRIIILRQLNGGVSRARNRGIRAAQGEYLAFLDGDDLWVPEKLEKHVTHLEASPQVGLSFSHSAFINEVGQPLGIYQTAPTRSITPSLILCRNPIGNGSTPVVRREVFAAIQFQQSYGDVVEPAYFDGHLHHIEDVECWLRIALQTQWQIEGIPEPLTLYRVNPGGASTNLSKQFTSLEQVLAKTRAYAPDLVAGRGNAAKAYQLRFLARRAIRQRSTTDAVTLVHRALATHWQIILEEPKKTLVTLAAAYVLWLLPQSFYGYLEVKLLKLTGVTRRQKFKHLNSPIHAQKMSQSKIDWQLNQS